MNGVMFVGELCIAITADLLVPVCLRRGTSEFSHRMKTALLFSYIIAASQRPGIHTATDRRIS